MILIFYIKRIRCNLSQGFNTSIWTRAWCNFAGRLPNFYTCAQIWNMSRWSHGNKSVGKIFMDAKTVWNMRYIWYIDNINCDKVVSGTISHDLLQWYTQLYKCASCTNAADIKHVLKAILIDSWWPKILTLFTFSVYSCLYIFFCYIRQSKMKLR